ncbi:hypothetical protein PDL71_04160 [Lacibacter sp. MH-610]|uniref:hypothetical protein n=1 Tax=Lacibacter sp. MH-610 TaxID=3020883 RepID=UPI0038918E0F
MKLLKHISTVLLIALLLLPLVTPAILQVQQLYVQWEMREALEEKELITVTMDAVEVQWIHNGKECIINGEMFDVKEWAQKDHQLTLTGLFDKKEKEIIAGIAHQTKEQKKNSAAGKWIKLFQLNVTAPSSAPAIQIIDYTKANLYNNYRSSLYASPFSGVVAPPPKYS